MGYLLRQLLLLLYWSLNIHDSQKKTDLINIDTACNAALYPLVTQGYQWPCGDCDHVRQCWPSGQLLTLHSAPPWHRRCITCHNQPINICQITSPGQEILKHKPVLWCTVNTGATHTIMISRFIDLIQKSKKWPEDQRKFLLKYLSF